MAQRKRTCHCEPHRDEAISGPELRDCFGHAIFDGETALAMTSPFLFWMTAIPLNRLFQCFTMRCDVSTKRAREFACVHHEWILELV